MQAETVRTFQEGMAEDDLFNIYERSYCANLLSAGAETPASLFVSIHDVADQRFVRRLALGRV